MPQYSGDSKHPLSVTANTATIPEYLPVCLTNQWETGFQPDIYAWCMMVTSHVTTLAEISEKNFILLVYLRLYK